QELFGEYACLNLQGSSEFTKELRALLDRPDDESCKDESYRKDLEDLVRLACERFDKAEAERDKMHKALTTASHEFLAYKIECDKRIKELEAGQLDFAKEMTRIHKDKIQRIKELEAENERLEKWQIKPSEAICLTDLSCRHKKVFKND
ncbi:hypothetical protein LCGC14_2836550, partial [marine sediment metagenome]